MPASQTDQTLTEALTEIGVRHEKSKRHDFGCRDLYVADDFLDSLDATNGWRFVHRAHAAA